MTKYLFLAIVAVALEGCAPVVRDYYLPTDTSARNEGYTCGWTPYGGYSKEIYAGVRLSLEVYPTDSGLKMGINMITSGPPFLSVVSKNPVVTIRPSPQAEGIATHIALTESKYVIDKRRYYSAQLNVMGEFSPHIVISLSGVQVEGKAVTLENLNFEKVTKNGVMACVQ